MLSIEQKNAFINTILELRDELECDALGAATTRQKLEIFENQLTLKELEECIFDATPEDFKTRLTECLRLQWERIRGRSMCYTEKPHNRVNTLRLELAKIVSPPITTPEEIKALKPNTGPYFLLMPSLENSEDVYGENIHNLGLHEFVLSDKERVFIPLASCLEEASISDEGQLRHIVMIDDACPALTPSEIERVTHHSKQVTDFYQSVLAFNKRRLLGDDIGPKLTQLTVALRGGGVKKGSGTENNAGAQANLGIFAFNEYWSGLSKDRQKAILKETTDLEGIIKRLFRAKDVNYQQVIFCVELIANKVDLIIEVYNKKPSIQALKEQLEAEANELKAALKKAQYPVNDRNYSPPKHILHLIYNLSTDEQTELFKYCEFNNALIYALANEPDALPEFELNEEAKQLAIQTRLGLDKSSGLIIAAKLGSVNGVKTLISWGADIESRDTDGLTALHWAASNGHIEAIKCLLQNGAQLEALTHRENTTLNVAIICGQRHVVDLLLKHSNLDARNIDGLNALDLAIKHYPELIEPVLIELATQPLNIQTKCLLKVPKGPYTNVFTYAASQQRPLFDALITASLQRPNIKPNNPLFTISDETGITALILAAQLGAKESVQKLIDFGIDIESHDIYGSTSLHWAASKGHMRTVDYLLEQGASLEARGHSSNTALNFAVMHGKKEVVNHLLKKNADINARNDRGSNALDLAIKSHPSLVEPILIQLTTLPTDKQAQCLLNRPDAPYPNVFVYAATIGTERLSNLLHSFSNRDNKRNQQLDAKMQNIYEHLHRIGLHYQEMKRKSANNSRYLAAASAAETLLTACINEMIKVYQNNGDNEDQIREFKIGCQKAIDVARPVLRQYREWGKVIGAFLLALFTLPVSLPLFAAGVFPIKTKSEQFLDNFQTDVNVPG